MFFQPVPTPLARDSAHVLVRVILHLDSRTSPPVGPSQLSAQPPAPSQPSAFSAPPPPRFPSVLHLSAWISRKPSRPVGQADCQPLAAWQRFSRLLVRLHHWVAFNSVFCCWCRNIVSPPCMSFSLLAACSCENGSPFYCLKCQM